MVNNSIDNVLKSYIKSLLWSSGEEFDGYSISDFDQKYIDATKKDISKFLDMVGQDEDAIEEMNTYSEEDFGHNLALSRNGHGAGFFDDNNDKLQDLARQLGPAEVYVGDDNRLHIFGKEVNENKNIKKYNKMEKIKIKKSELTEAVQRSIIKVMAEEKAKEEAKKKEKINESVAEILTVLGGAGAIGLTSWGIAEVMTALENGKLGDNGKKLANILNNIGGAANSGKQYKMDDTKTPTQPGPDDTPTFNESKKVTIKLSELKKLLEESAKK